MQPDRGARGRTPSIAARQRDRVLILLGSGEQEPEVQGVADLETATPTSLATPTASTHPTQHPHSLIAAELFQLRAAPPLAGQSAGHTLTALS